MKIAKDHSGKFYAFADQAVVSGGSFLLSILLARWAGLEIFGAFTMIFMMVLLINNFNQAIITHPLITLLTKQIDKEGYNQGVKFLQLLMIIPYALVISCIIFLFDKLLTDVSGYSVYFGFLALGILYQLHDFARKSYFSSQHHYKAFVLDSLVFGLQFVLITFFYWQNSLNLGVILYSVAISYSLAVPVIFWGFRLREAVLKLPDTLKLHWQFSGWLVATSFVHWLAGNNVFIIAGTLLGLSAVGILKVGQSLVGAILALYQVFENYVPPKAASIIQNHGGNTMWRYLFSVLGKGGIIVVFLAGIIAVFPEVLVSIFYGGKYLDQVTIVRLFVLLSAITFPGYIFRIGIRTKEDNLHIFLAYLFNICFSFAAAYYFINHYGITGAVWVLIFSQVIMLSWYMIYYLRTEQEWGIRNFPLSFGKRANR